MAAIRMTLQGLRRRNRLTESNCCLGCETPLEEAAQVRCGLCPPCYQAVLRAESNNPSVRRQLIKAGQMLPATRGGRRSLVDFRRELAEG